MILGMGVLANLCMGASYASSVFAKPLIIFLNLMKADPAGQMVPDMSRWALIFSFNLACLPLGMLLSGKIADLKSPRAVIIFGGILFGLGMFLTGFADSFLWVFCFFGIMMGIGSGAAYGAIVATVVRWFPDKRGLAGGIAVGALGCGTLIIAPLAQYLMSHVPASEVPVLWAFKVFGVAFLIIIILASILMDNPPACYKPSGWEPKAQASGKPALEFTWNQLFSRLNFWILYGMYACGAFAGLMIISQASPIAQKMTRLSPESAVKIVALIGLANALGRVFWGYVSDKIGRLSSILAMFFITAIAMFLLPSAALKETPLLISVLFVGLCFGGYLGIFPSVCADYFGTRNLTLNYALLFSAFSIAAITGPMVGAKIVLLTDSYARAFNVAGTVSVAGGILTLVAITLKTKKWN